MGRCGGQVLPEGIDLVRTPVALMFVRGDRAAPGKTLAEQVVASFGYWNLASEKFLDLVFFGWYKEGENVGFQPIKGKDEAGIFVDCYREIQRISKWRYSGETDILLADFEMVRSANGGLNTPGRFSFKNCIYLPVEQMMQEGRTRSLDALVQEIVEAARVVYEEHPLEAGAFEISDRVGWTRGKRAFWMVVREKFLRDWRKVYDELRPFVVCDLSVGAT
jgi:hypothetical protein